MCRSGIWRNRNAVSTMSRRPQFKSFAENASVKSLARILFIVAHLHFPILYNIFAMILEKNGFLMFWRSKLYLLHLLRTPVRLRDKSCWNFQVNYATLRAPLEKLRVSSWPGKNPLFARVFLFVTNYCCLLSEQKNVTNVGEIQFLDRNWSHIAYTHIHFTKSLF